MRSKIVKAVFIATVLLFNSFPAGAGSSAPVNPDFLKWREQLERAPHLKNSVLTDDACNLRAVPPSGFNLSHLSKADFSPFLRNNPGVPVNKGGSAKNAAEVSLPVSFDLRAEGRVPSGVRNQAPLNLCWSFSAMASMESSALTQGLGSYDLSEWIFGYMSCQDISSDKPSFSFPPESYDHTGIFLSIGNNNMSAAFAARGTGPVREEEAPYPARKGELTEALYRPTNFAPVLGLRRTYMLDFGHREALKRAIELYGAVSAAFFWWGDEGLAADGKSYFLLPKIPKYTNTNHLVTIVGWDDTYAKGNFKESRRPSADGAWIVRNSRGKDFGEGGYFYISYEEGSLASPMIFEVSAVDDGANIYEYDPLGLVSGWSPHDKPGLGDETAWGANIYTADRDEWIKSISFYALTTNTSYEISLQTNLRGGGPEGTVRSFVNGTLDLPGYVTVDLPHPVRIAEGEDFSVVMKIRTPGYRYPLGAESIEKGYSEKAVSNSGRSWLSPDGKNWEIFGERGDLCLKAIGVAAHDNASVGCNAFDGVAVFLAVIAAAALFKKRR